MPRAYSITAEAIAAERERVGGDLHRFDLSEIVRLDHLELPRLRAEDVRVRILAASGEHNIVHAALADSVNIVEKRGGKVYPGSCFVAEVLETGSRVGHVRPGDIVIPQGTPVNDPYGYPLRIWSYDEPGSIGCYGEETIVQGRMLRPAPLSCGLNLWELAASQLRAVTAHHLWRRGEQMFRVKIPREKLSRLNVLAFGGGTSEFFLMLARAEGHRAFYCSANPARRAALERRGIVGIDQAPFHRFATADDVRAFRRTVKRLTEGVGMHVVCDMFRGPVFAAGLAAQARQGVNVSAGWQLSQLQTYNSAAMSIEQITIDHVHFETVDGCRAAFDLLGPVFRPHLHEEIYGFEDVPRALSELHRNVQTGIPVIRIAEEMPECVRHLVPEDATPPQKRRTACPTKEASPISG